MRILHLSTFLQGGAGRAITDLAIAQRAQGHHVTVIIDGADQPGYQTYKEYLNRLQAADIAVHRVASTFKRDLPKNLAAVEQLRLLLDVGELDLIHTHAAVPSLIARLWASRSRRPVPVVQTVHGWGITKTEEQAASDVTVLNLVDEVVVPAHTSANFLRSLGVSRDLITIVPYGIPNQESSPLPDRNATLLADLRNQWSLMLGCVGTINERKNQRLVIDALVHVRGVVAGCIFIGDGDTAALADYARSRGVADRTVVLGYRPNASQYLQQMDACVLASRSEGQPLTILEAYRDGVPVIASNIEEIKELVDHEVSGVLFAKNDAKALAAAIERVAHGKGHAIANRARAKYEARHTLDRMVDGYAAVYKGAIERRLPTYAEVR